MEEIFKPPNSAIGENLKMEIEPWKKILCTVFVLPPIFLYLLGYKIIPQFAESFASFGADLPWETLLVIRIYPYLPWLSLVSALPLLIWINGKTITKYRHKLFIISVFHVCFSIFEFFFLQWAIYAPVAEMGSVI